jgi:hypothetical protein
MGSDAVIVLAEARAVGLDVRAEPGRLVVRGPRSLEGVAQRLLERTAEVLVLLAAEETEVMRRVDAMRPQVPTRGAIPVLVARERPPKPGCCVSCGESLHGEMRYRCSLCARATWLVLHEIREDLRPENQ